MAKVDIVKSIYSGQWHISIVVDTEAEAKRTVTGIDALEGIDDPGEWVERAKEALRIVEAARGATKVGCGLDDALLAERDRLNAEVGKSE